MENNSNRRILFAIGFVLLFVIIVIIWYFFYAKPIMGVDITKTNDPFPVSQSKPRSGFIMWGNDDVSTSTTEIVDPLSVPLIRIWDKPATGQVFVSQNILKEVIVQSTQGTTTIETKKTVRASSTVVMFVDRTTGYVYGYPVETGKPFQISNTVVPGVHDAQIFDDGRKIILRYVDQDNSKIVTIIATVPNVQENETPLPLTNMQYITSSVLSIATNYKKDRASYLVETETGSAIYSVTSKGSSLVTTSPFKEWNLSYGGDALYVTTKPSAYISGTTMSIPTFQPEVESKTGLMSNPGSNGVFFNSMWGAQGLANFISKDGILKVTNTKTIASKCAWGERQFLVCGIPRTLPFKNTEGLPDDWFQGRVTFNDDLFIVDTSTGDAYELYTFKPEDGVFDVTNITISKENVFIAFNKRQNANLWLLNTNLVGSQGGE